MSIAIMIGTHGAAAEQLLHTAEMILGKQENIAFIDFVPGENTDTLKDKYSTKLSALNTSEGILFLVDTWGGSPFNAASQMANEQTNNEVIAGVNIPMLVETLMSRDDNPAFAELVQTALTAGRAGVRSLKHQEPVPISQSVAKTAAIPPISHGVGGHMKIVLARIDDRLIHGQVATRWTKETNVSRIIVVSDEIARDTVRSTLLKQVAPPGVSAHVVDIAKAIRVYNNPEYAGERVMLLFNNPTDVLRLVEADVEIKSVNIGGMAFRDGRTQVNNAVSVGPEDIAAFEKLNARGLELEVRKVATDARLSMIDLLKKIG